MVSWCSGNKMALLSHSTRPPSVLESLGIGGRGFMEGGNQPIGIFCAFVYWDGNVFLRGGFSKKSAKEALGKIASKDTFRIDCSCMGV